MMGLRATTCVQKGISKNTLFEQNQSNYYWEFLSTYIAEQIVSVEENETEGLKLQCLQFLLFISGFFSHLISTEQRQISRVIFRTPGKVAADSTSQWPNNIYRIEPTLAPQQCDYVCC
jgi:hypothetical protein